MFFTIIGYIFVLLNEVRHTFGMGLPQCLFHMPHIVPRMVTVVEESNDRLNAFHTLLIPVLEPHAVTDVAPEAEVPLEKLPPKAGVQPGGRTLAIVTTLLCPQRVASVTS